MWLIVLLLLILGALECNALRAPTINVNSARVDQAAVEIRKCAAISSQQDCIQENCHWCSKDALPVCVHSAELSVLLKDAYTCSADQQPSRPVEINAAVNAKTGNPADPCEGKDQKACDADDQCTWCKSAAVPSSCYTRAQSKYLPPAVFTCDKPAPSKR